MDASWQDGLSASAAQPKDDGDALRCSENLPLLSGAVKHLSDSKLENDLNMFLAANAEELHHDTSRSDACGQYTDRLHRIHRDFQFLMASNILEFLDAEALKEATASAGEHCGTAADKVRRATGYEALLSALRESWRFQSFIGLTQQYLSECERDDGAGGVSDVECCDSCSSDEEMSERNRASDGEQSGESGGESGSENEDQDAGT